MSATPRMELAKTRIDGVYLVHSPMHTDERGTFVRSYDADTFNAAGLPTNWPQHNVSHTTRAGTLRGLHLQVGPAAEGKLIRCIQGRVYDVVADVRPESETYGTWFGTYLDSTNPLAVYAPAGTAHGFLTMEPRSTLYYLMSARYAPGAGRTIRWDDPDLAIDWPSAPKTMSKQDEQGAPLASWTTS